MTIKGKYRIFLAFLLIFLVLYIFTGFKFTKVKILVISNDESKIEHLLTVPNATFTLSYIHSVHHTPVYETFEIDNERKLNLKETKFYSLGVGMPFTDEGGSFINNNGEFVLKFSRKFDNLFLRVSSIPEHAIEIGANKYPLLQFAKPDQRIKIYAKEKWMLMRHN